MSNAQQVDLQPHQALVRAAVERTMRWTFRTWGFGESVALRGLLAASRATGDREPLGFVRALLRSYVGRGVGRSPEEHVAPGTELLLLHALDGDDAWLDAARALASLYLAAPMGPHGVRYRRPDLPGWRRQIWVDSMDGAPPFLTRLARVTGDETYTTEAERELVGYTRLLQDDRTGLLVHGFEENCGTNGQYWARGNGWAAMGLIETLAFVPRRRMVRRRAAPTTRLALGRSRGAAARVRPLADRARSPGDADRVVTGSDDQDVRSIVAARRVCWTSDTGRCVTGPTRPCSSVCLRRVSSRW